jgi:UDP-N-acetylglucosamine 2-epimerase (non-hydrolysing)
MLHYGRTLMSEPEILLLLGTRPEGVKLAPLVGPLREQHLRATIVDTGQHPGRAAQALTPFDLRPDVVLSLDRETGSLAELGARLITATDEVLSTRKPAAVVVQGDTLTSFVGGLVAFWHRVPVVHLEAGLRTHDLDRPFPEEANRAMLARFAALHLAPTEVAVRHLLAEGVPAGNIVLTGNTVVDALTYLIDSGRASAPRWVDRSRPIVVVTAHRRENWGDGLARIAVALREIVRAEPQVQIVVVTHPNPALHAAVSSLLSGVPGVTITPPLDYPSMVGLLDAASLVITDSGGIQEEAATLGIPLLVTRETTERPEAVGPGLGVLVGTDPDLIVPAAREGLRSGRRRCDESPFGDGRAAPRAATAILDLVTGQAANSLDRGLVTVSAGGDA